MRSSHLVPIALTADSTGTLVAAVDPATELPTHAVGVLAAENEQTADRRFFDPGAFTWRQPPLTLTLNHDPDQRIGAVTQIGRVASADGLTVDNFAERVGAEGSLIVGLIEFDLGLGPDGELADPDALGRTAARQASTEGGSGPFLAGISVEFGNEAFELECLESDDDGFCVDYLMRFTAAEIGQVTLTGFQALDSARVVATSTAPAAAASDDAGSEGDAADAVAASGTPRRTSPVQLRAALLAAAPRNLPARSDFDDPGLLEPTPMTIDGMRIYGHGALWNTCHVGIADQCVLAPRSPSGYAYFHTGEIETTEGRIPCGVFTMGCGHAPVYHADRRPLTSAETVAHYDDLGTQAAYIRCGEDDHGIWFAGVLNPDLTDGQVRALSAGAMSGDWRRIGGALEMVATLAVNVPGYPVPRTQGIAAGGAPMALVAAGIVQRTGCGCGGGSTDLAELTRRVGQLEATVRLSGAEDAALEALSAAVRPRGA